MKGKWLLVGVFLVGLILALIAGLGFAQGAATSEISGGAPTVVSYQGKVHVGGAPYTGDGYSKFAVVNAAGNRTYWSNDGTSSAGGEPAAVVKLTVRDGYFSILLGDNTLSGMSQQLTAEVFDEPDRYLRVWFSPSLAGPFHQLAPDSRIASVPYALQAERVPGYAGVVAVAKNGGDFTTIQAAIDSITDNAVDNPYLVWVAPGRYEEQVTMKPYVHLQGAGQEATVIGSTASSSTSPPTQATLKLASDTSLRDLTVNNIGTGEYNAALLATANTTRTTVADVTARALGRGVNNSAISLDGSSTGVMLQQVTALAEYGSSNNIGLSIHNGLVTLHDGSFTGRGGTHSTGIENRGTLEADDVIALAENGSVNQAGLYNVGGFATLRGGSFTGYGGPRTYGIYTTGMLEAESVSALGENGSSANYGLVISAGLVTLRGGSFTGRGGADAVGISCSGGHETEAEHVTALGEDGSDTNYGLVSGGGTVNSTQSVLEGASNSVRRTGGSVTISNSRLASGQVSGTVTCVAVSWSTTFYPNTCPVEVTR